jgi:hypothetical protein
MLCIVVKNGFSTQPPHLNGRAQKQHGMIEMKEPGTVDLV